MGKVLSKQRKLTDADASGDEESTSRSSKKKKWFWKRNKKEIRRLGKEMGTQTDEKFEFHHQSFSDDVAMKGLEQSDILSNLCYNFCSEKDSARFELKQKGLDDSIIDIINRLGLSTSFFLTTDQRQGSSSWENENPPPEYPGIRSKKLLTKGEIVEQARQAEKDKIKTVAFEEMDAKEEISPESSSNVSAVDHDDGNEETDGNEGEVSESDLGFAEKNKELHVNDKELAGNEEDKEFDGNEEGINGNDEEVDGDDEKVAESDKDLAENDKELAQNDEEFDGNDEEVDESDKERSENDEELAQNDEELAQNDERVDGNDEEVAENDEEVAESDEERAENDEELAQNDKELAQNVEKIDSNDEEVAENDEERAENDEELAQNDEEADDINEKIDENEEEIYDLAKEEATILAPLPRYEESEFKQMLFETAKEKMDEAKCQKPEEIAAREKSIDGLYAHLYHFSPKLICNGGPVSLACAEDHFVSPMIEITTEERPDKIIASIMINQTVAKQHARNGLAAMHTIRMCDTLIKQMNRFNFIFNAQWTEFGLQVGDDVYHRFATAQVLLPKAVTSYQCSLAEAERIGIC